MSDLTLSQNRANFEVALMIGNTIKPMNYCQEINHKDLETSKKKDTVKFLD